LGTASGGTERSGMEGSEGLDFSHKIVGENFSRNSTDDLIDAKGKGRKEKTIIARQAFVSGTSYPTLFVGQPSFPGKLSVVETRTKTHSRERGEKKRKSNTLLKLSHSQILLR
jgi:hypothetical protein